MMDDTENERVPILRKGYHESNPIKGDLSVSRFLRSCWQVLDEDCASSHETASEKSSSKTAAGKGFRDEVQGCSGN